MIYKQYLKEENIKAIYDSKQLYLSKNKECADQERFCMDEKMLSVLLSNLYFDTILYDVTKGSFMKLCSMINLNFSYKLYSDYIYGVSYLPPTTQDIDGSVIRYVDTAYRDGCIIRSKKVILNNF